MELRIFNEKGRRQWESWLTQLKNTPSLKVPTGILENSQFSIEPDTPITLPKGPFGSKLAFAQAILPAIEALEAQKLPEEYWPGVWDALALLYFDEICPVIQNDKRKPGEIERYLWSPKYSRFFKHRVATSVLLLRSYGEAARVFLWGPPDTLSDYEIQICSRQEWIGCRAVGEACNLLYFDFLTSKPKPGGMSKSRPGALFHFVKVVPQLARTFDLYDMSGSGLLRLLPDAFDSWKTSSSVEQKNS